jgi:small subunit ribosomal protein S1
VVVLGINRDERRIALGHKQIDENPWDAFEEKYKVETDTTGTISRIIDKGLIVTLPLGVDGFIPITHLGPSKLKKAIDYYKEGDEVPAKVIEFDKENKKIVLSISNYFKDKETKEWETYLTKQGVEKTTLKELLKEEVSADQKKTEAKEQPKKSVPTKTAKEAEIADGEKKTKKEEVPKDEKTVKEEKLEQEKTSKEEKGKAEVAKTVKEAKSKAAAESVDSEKNSKIVEEVSKDKKGETKGKKTVKQEKGKAGGEKTSKTEKDSTKKEKS